MPQSTKNLDSTGADSCTEEKKPSPRNSPSKTLYVSGEMMGKTNNGEDGQVLPADKVLDLTESIGTLSEADHSGVKDVLLLESVQSVRKMKHVPAQRQSRGAQRVTVSIHATAQTLPQHQRN